jgi:thiamine-phosphate pyrophosphorylase
LRDCKLYVIIDRGIIKKRDCLEVANAALRGGADILQLRDKSSDDRSFLEHAKALKNLTKNYKRLFIVNDRVDIACIIGADGVHLGQEDMPIESARKILKKGIIGISTHSVEQAKRAEKKGADYIGIGPIYKTEAKKAYLPIGPSVLHRISTVINAPFFAIGGISLNNIKKVKKAGAKRVAVISSAIMTADVDQSVRKLREAIDR